MDDGRLVLVDEDGRRLEPVDEVIVLLAAPCSSCGAQILSRTAAPVPEEDAWARHRPTVRDALTRGTAAPCPTRLTSHRLPGFDAWHGWRGTGAGGASPWWTAVMSHLSKHDPKVPIVTPCGRRAPRASRRAR